MILDVDNFRPMLAEPLDKLESLCFPVDATLKLDGWRITTLPGLGPVTRKLLQIPNAYTRMLMATLPPFLDGEMIIPNAEHFGKTSSPFAKHTGAPAFEFHAFDWIEDPSEEYQYRVARLEDWAMLHAPAWVKILRPKRLYTVEEVQAFYDAALEAGHEGIILRDPKAKYKCNRSTLREQGMLKLKPFVDFEAEVIGFEELMRNENEQTRDELGFAKRSSAKAGLVPGGTLGKLVLLRADGVKFGCGSGLDDKLRRWIWANRPKVLGKFVTCKMQKHGAKDAPRIPVFVRFRDPIDMS